MKVFEKLFPLNFDEQTLTDNLLVFEAHRPNKISFHIVIDGLLDTSAVSSQLGEAPYQNSVSVKVDRGAQRSLLTFTSLAYQCKRSG